MRLRAPKLCVEIGKFGLLTFDTPIRKSALVKLADAFEVKTPRQLALLHALVTNAPSEHTAELQKLREILSTGKEFTYHGSGIIDTSFTEGFVNSGHVDLLDPAGIEYASFTIGPSCLRIVKRDVRDLIFEDFLTLEEVWEHTKDRMEILQKRFRGRLGLENELYQAGGGTEHVTDPAFLNEFFRRYPGALFLLDLAHARIVASALRVDILYYLKNLPLERVKHIHLSHPTWTREKGMLDTHLAPEEEDFAYFELALRLGARPEYLTIEYYREEAPLVESYRTLQRLFRPQRKSSLVKGFALLDFGFKNAHQRIEALSGYDYEEISRIAEEHLRVRQEAIFKEIQELETRRGVVADTPANVAVHTTNIFKAFIQARIASYEDLARAKDPHQL